MRCSELESVLEREGLAPLSAEAREHLAQCSACGHFVAEVSSIVAMAHDLPAEIEPPARIWISIRAELESEGLIRGAAREQTTSPWWESIAQLFRNRGLATAAVTAMVLVVALLLFRTPRAPVLEAHDDFGPTLNLLSQQESDLANMRLASTSADVPMSPVDTSLQQNLQQVDEFIADCQRHLKEVPSDELAREYLTNAYQQKAELLSTMIDRGGSLN
jgi:anti-sigma-K factor RskA